MFHHVPSVSAKQLNMLAHLECTYLSGYFILQLFCSFFQAQTFHLSVPENIALEEAIKKLFDPNGEEIENVKCQDCDQAVTIRKRISIIDPKVIRGFKVWLHFKHRCEIGGPRESDPPET